MSVHFSAKRLTRLKTYSIKEENWEKITEWFKRLEYLGEQCTKAVRNVKKHLKELNKLYNDNENKRNKNKLTKKDCEKERELSDKIEGYISDLKEFIEKRDKYIEFLRDALSVIDYDMFTNEFKFDRDYLHTMKSNTPREE